MINLENIDKFKLLYRDAVSKGDEMFVFEGRDVLTSYAKYVIEYFILIFFKYMFYLKSYTITSTPFSINSD